jgi:hypothetical protein
MPITGAYGGVIGVDNTPTSSKSVTQITSSGCFCRTTATATVVVIAGGGSGCYGGGGAGGVLVTTCHPLPASTVPVTIGAGGGTITSEAVGNAGNNTVFGSATPLTALKGMGGGGGNSYPVSDGPQQPAGTSAYDGGIYGSGGGSGGANPAAGGKGTHPGPYGGCSPTYQGSPGGHGAFATGGGACNLGLGHGNSSNKNHGGRGRDLTPLGVPTDMGDCGIFGGGGGAKTSAGELYTPGVPLTDQSSGIGKKAAGGGGRGQTGTNDVLTFCCVALGSSVGDANTGGGGGAGTFNDSPNGVGDVDGMAGGSGTVLVIQDVAGASANDGIYSMKEHYICVKSSRW